MPCTPRLEKHKGITLLVRTDWVSVVHDGTGFMFEGPAKDDATMKRIVAIVIPALQKLGGEHA